MKKRLWIAATLVVGMAPVWAQPDNKGAMAPSDEMAVSELERAIGGRTTLELKFKDLTTEQLAEEITKSSGLRVLPPAQSSFGTVSKPDSFPEPTWDGDVDRTDFWLALRKWGRAENLRLQRELDALKQRQKNEVAPPVPVAAEGETVASEVMKEWQKKQMEWTQRRLSEFSRFDPNATLSALYNANSAAWNLSPNSELATGDIFNAWPCLVQVTRFDRQQSFSIQKNEMPHQALEDDNATSDKVKPEQETMVNRWGEEATEGGFMRDALSLSMAVYVEPKLLKRANVRVRVDEARDDTGEELLAESQSRLQTGVVNMSFNYGGKDSGISHQIHLRPRQARGRKLTLRGVVTIRYPMKLQEHEITNFDGTQKFLLNTEDLPIDAQLDPPHIENGRLRFKVSTTLNSERGGRWMKKRWEEIFRSRDFAADSQEGVLGYNLLPDDYTFIDNQGRTWSVGGSHGSRGGRFRGPDGKPIPVTSPPTPPPDDFTYTEEKDLPLQLLPPNAPPGYQSQNSLPPEELANVRFTKATFTTESDWRTLEVPFEFHDLPLPPR